MTLRPELKPEPESPAVLPAEHGDYHAATKFNSPAGFSLADQEWLYTYGISEFQEKSTFTTINKKTAMTGAH